MDASESVPTPVLVERGKEEVAGDEKLLGPTSASAPQRSIWDANWDTWVGGRAATHSTRVLLLVRHGHYTDGGCSDGARVLTALGRLQATATGHRLRSRLEALGCELPARIVHSTFVRAAQTAQIIRDTAFADCNTVLQADADLREGAPCVPTPNWWKPSDADVARDSVRIERSFRRWFHRDVDVAGPPADDVLVGPPRAPLTPVAAAAAAAPAVAEGSTPVAPPQAVPVAARHRAEILVCHGNVIRFLVLRALQLPPDAWLRLVVPHASITTVAITCEGDVLLQGLGDAGHIEADLVT